MMLHRLRRYDEGGQAPDPMQLLQAYAQANQMSEEDFAQLVQEFKSMTPEEQQQALQAISQQLQQMQQQAQPQGMTMGADANQIPQEQGNPMIAQLGARVENAIYDPVFKTYTYELPKAAFGDSFGEDDTAGYFRVPPPTQKIVKKTVNKPIVKPVTQTVQTNTDPEVADLQRRAQQQPVVVAKEAPVSPTQILNSTHLAEILNNDVSNYRKTEERNNKGFDYIPTSDTQSFMGKNDMLFDVPRRAQIPVEKEGLWQLKSDKLSPVFAFQNGDSILFDKESSNFVKRKSRSGKYEPITQVDMQTASYFATPSAKKLIEKHYNVQ
jgi:hypothetical protein